MHIEKHLEVIASCDPAVDTEAMTEADMLEYMRARDVSKLKIKQGEKPTRFRLRAVSKAQLADIMRNCTTDADRCLRAFRYAVVQASDAYDENGKTFTFSPANVAAGVTEDEFERTFDMAEALDVGSVAWARSFLGRRIAPRYAPQPLLLAHLARLPFLSAEPSDAAMSNSNPSVTPESSAPAATLRDARSALPTAAHATAEISPQAG